MGIEDTRKEVLLWSIVEGHEDVTNRLLDMGVELPEVLGDFYITINGVPACVADHALVGNFYHTVCQHSSLHRSIRHRHRLRAVFHGAVVAVIAGSCPTIWSFLKAA